MRWRPMRVLARVNRRITNPAFLGAAARLPGYANVVHVGRRTGRRYRTPVGTTWRGTELRIALNYGQGSDWVRNTLAAGRFELEHRGRVLAMTEPEIVVEVGRPFLSARVDARKG
ncbi:nitroreductase family deazaflavin-dependent oxidoreductase [Nocardia otitidiscaviarum]|nr:nitroreductase family deazaflavin-dependent oxidoreductase [Nocardia otitidiscaviarum]MBF6487393.1 nitroreductase family deazaflavin-dependent oxidoreductase [Nocardia otitidiscaviarum]